MNVRVLAAIAMLAGGCASALPVEHPTLDIALPQDLDRSRTARRTAWRHVVAGLR